MKLKKNVNYNTVIAKLAELQELSQGLQGDFRKVIGLLEDSKLGITEIDYKLDEDLVKFKNTFGKIEELIRGL